MNERNKEKRRMGSIETHCWQSTKAKFFVDRKEVMYRKHNEGESVWRLLEEQLSKKGCNGQEHH